MTWELPGGSRTRELKLHEKTPTSSFHLPTYNFNSALIFAKFPGSIEVSPSFDCLAPGVLRPFST